MEKYHLLITKLVTFLCVTVGGGGGGGGWGGGGGGGGGSNCKKKTLKSIQLL